MAGKALKEEPIKNRKPGQPPGPGKKGSTVIDGFRTIREPESLRVEENNIAPFTLPVEALLFSPPKDIVIHQFKNGDRERKVYCNIELSDVELEQLKQLQEEVKRKGLTFVPSIATMATRFLSRARGDPHKAIKLMQATNAWRLDYFASSPVSDSDVIEDMKHGIVYFCGRDSKLRPTIVVRAIRIPHQWYKEKRTDKLIRILIFCMEYMIRYMFVPGRIENNCLIIDLKGLGISQVPLSALAEVYRVMSHHYIGRVFKFYICNLSSGLSTIAGMAKGMLTDRQKQKLVFLDNVTELRKDFALHHLEEDLGGHRPVIKEFFPFPLQAGPFEGGCDTGPDPSAVPGGHSVLTAVGARGRLWSPQLPRDENVRLEYGPGAAEFFRRGELPVPPACLESTVASPTGADCPGKGNSISTLTTGPGGDEEYIANTDTPCSPNTDTEMIDENSGEDSESDDIIIQDGGYKPKGPFSCIPCWCTHK